MSVEEGICQRCLGTGWVFDRSKDREVARACDCREKNGRDARSKQSNIPSRFSKCELGSYFPQDNSVTQKKAKQGAEKFIRDYPAVAGGLLFVGPTGVGKTRLLCSIGNQLVREKNIDLFYIDWNDLVREMRSGEDMASRDFSTITALMQRLVSVELLLFDEIGSSRTSPWVVDNIYYLVNRRYNENRVTLFATNFFDKKISEEETLSERIGERIRSRIYEMTQIVEIRGKDYRNKHWGNKEG